MGLPRASVAFGHLCLFLSIVAAALAEPVIHTSMATFHGSVADNGANQFLGIRYAQPPVGPLRWHAPVAYTYGDDASLNVDASKYGDVCYQSKSNVPHDSMSEDCLSVNIYTPSYSSPTGRLPVMVFIHGGAFIMGTPTFHPAHVLAQDQKVIAITFGYRLGVFGFLVTRDLIKENQPLNFGLLDQQAAMKWVKKYISYFGGDEENITLFGESAGAASVGYHLLFPSSWPYFNKAILESTGGLQDLQSAEEIANTEGRRLEIATTCALYNNALNCLRDMTSSSVFSFASVSGVLWAPVVDNIYVTEWPALMFRKGMYRPNTPVIVGHNMQEGVQFASGAASLVSLGYLKGEDTIHKMNSLIFEAVIRSIFTVNSTITSEVHQWYADAKLTDPASPQVLEAQQNLNITLGLTSEQIFNKLSAIIGDYLITCPSYIVSQSLVINKASRNSPIFHYLFTHQTAKWDFAYQNATHQAELAYVFGVDVEYNTKFTPEEEKLKDQVMNWWGTFAYTGAPEGGWGEYDGSLNSVAVIDIPNTATAADPAIGTVYDHCIRYWEPYFLKKI